MKSLLLVALVLFSTVNARSDYFPENYEYSRARFLNEVDRLRTIYPRAESSEILVGSEKLAINTVYLPAMKNPRNLIILTSGNHGPEGYAGSALQYLFSSEVLRSLDLNTTGILLVHALNPWGFKHHRRGTENNVNLNRNFSDTRALFKTRNDEYDKLRPFLEPTAPVRCSSAFPAKNLLLEMILKRDVTQQSLTEAIGKGQYDSPEGINYGGSDFEPQTLEIIALLKRIAAPYPAILHIDLHTGLGKKGVLHVMTKKEMNDRSTRALSSLFRGHPEDSGRYELTPPEAEGFYEILGDYATILGKLFPEPARVIIGLTAEFGTVGNGLGGKTETINRLILENEGYFHSYRSPEVEKRVKQKYLELFYPSSPKWREGVIRNGRYLVDTVLKRFISESEKISE